MSYEAIALTHARRILAARPTTGASLLTDVGRAVEVLTRIRAEMLAAGIDAELAEATCGNVLLAIIREQVELGVPAGPGAVTH